jgi:toxin ParE1/3/4
MARAIWTPTARRELDEIHDFIGIERHSQSAAEKLVRDIHKKAELYASQPRTGTSRPDLGDDFRVFHHKPCIIVVRASPEGIEVLRVIDGRRDYEKLFG